MRIIMAVFVAFCVAATSMVLPTYASQQLKPPKSLGQYGDSAVRQQTKITMLPLLSRKLNKIGRSMYDNVMVPHKELLMEASFDDNTMQSENEEGMVDDNAKAGKGRWREFVEAPSTNTNTNTNRNSEEYYTMDYAWLRRRHPIHNKNIPNYNSVP